MERATSNQTSFLCRIRVAWKFIVGPFSTNSYERFFLRLLVKIVCSTLADANIFTIMKSDILWFKMCTIIHGLVAHIVFVRRVLSYFFRLFPFNYCTQYMCNNEVNTHTFNTPDLTRKNMACVKRGKRKTRTCFIFQLLCELTYIFFCFYFTIGLMCIDKSVPNEFSILRTRM